MLYKKCILVQFNLLLKAIPVQEVDSCTILALTKGHVVQEVYSCTIPSLTKGHAVQEVYSCIIQSLTEGHTSTRSVFLSNFISY